MSILNRSLQASRRMRGLLFTVACIYTLSFLVGQLMMHMQEPSVVEFTKLLIEDLSESPTLNPILGALMTGDVAVAVALTFLVNLMLGAFLSTTLIGAVPILGGVGVGAISAVRGFVVGATYYYVFGVSVAYTIVAVGTALLELGAYVFSGAAGINISLSTIFPRRYNVDSRWIAFKEAWKDAGRIYVVVVILLALGAIWEMVGIYVVSVVEPW